MFRYIVSFVIILLIIYFIFSPYCSNKEDNIMVNKWKGGIIKKYGTYKTEDGKIIIIVSEEPKGILKYVVKDSNDITLFSSSYDRYEEISVYHRWRLYWDNTDGYLWVCSSDRGDFIWTKRNGEQYQVRAIEDGSEYAKIIPESLVRELSNHSQKRYNAQKKKN